METEAQPNGTKRPRGRPPGLGKVPGSGRKAGGRNHVSKSAKEGVTAVLDKNAGRLFQRLCNIAFGLKIRIGDAAGPNPRYIFPSETSQMKALEILAKKLRPDLQAQALTGADDSPLFPEGPADPRDTARAIADILRQATIEDQHSPPALPGPMEPPYVQSSDNRPEPSPAFEPSETEVFDNGAYVELVEIAASGERKWAVYDAAGALHGYRRNRETAVALAQALKRGGN